jgi:putative N-acetylmannosamine-6-phosphate epimerase
LTSDPIADLKGGLVVSCQAPDGSPLRSTAIMAAMARAAEHGGARGIRADGAADVAAIVEAVSVPVIGIKKIRGRAYDRVFITPGFDDAAEIAAAGARIIALDGTPREREGPDDLPGLIRRLHEELGVLVMADVDCLESGRFAADAGADLVSTTLSGYTSSEPTPDEPDFGLIEALASVLSTPVVAEGRLWSREHVAAAFAAGAHTAVVGSAITNVVLSTRRLVGGLPG